MHLTASQFHSNTGVILEASPLAAAAELLAWAHLLALSNCATSHTPTPRPTTRNPTKHTPVDPSSNRKQPT